MQAFMWDYEILALLMASAYGIVRVGLWLIRSWKSIIVKKKITALVTETFFVLVFATVIYGSFIEPHRIIIREQRIQLGTTKVQEQIKIVFIADLHAGPYKGAGYFERVADKIAEIKPDVILMGGDFIYSKPEEAWQLLPLKKVTELYPTYAITGNHEYGAGSEKVYYEGKIIDKTGPLATVLEQMKVHRLANQAQLVNVKGSLFYLAGIDDMWSQPDTVNQALTSLGGQVTDSMPTVLLAHNADIMLEPASTFFDVILSGHTHGGQIRLPLIGGLMVPNKTGRKYDMGWFRLPQENQLYITAGIGESGPRARLFDPPEITVISLDL